MGICFLWFELQAEFDKWHHEQDHEQLMKYYIFCKSRRKENSHHKTFLLQCWVTTYQRHPQEFLFGGSQIFQFSGKFSLNFLLFLFFSGRFGEIFPLKSSPPKLVIMQLEFFALTFFPLPNINSGWIIKSISKFI